MKVMNYKNGLQLACTLGAVAAGMSIASATPLPMFEYNFNETGSTATNSGTVASRDGVIKNTSGIATDLHTADGGGVSGLAGDRAFDNSASSAMGTSGAGGRIDITDSVALNGSTGVTVAGWFKTAEETPVGNQSYLLDLGVWGSGKAGLLLSRNQNGEVLSTIYGQAATSETLVSAVGAFNETQSWVFLAVTYDSTVSGESNFKIYKGTKDSAATVIADTEASVGAYSATTVKVFGIGNVGSANIRPFDGFIDQVNIYGGTLTASEIEDLRLNAIPEPATFGLLALGGLMLSGRSRRQ